MPIPLPKLDDRTYEDLTAEARALIPRLHPGWTNHNASDPGIALVELLAWLTEMLLYQVDDVPPASTKAFLALLNGPDWPLPADADLHDATMQTLRDVRERYRSVTPGDFEYLTLQSWPRTPDAQALGPAGRVARAQCVPRRNLETTDPKAFIQPAPAHISVVVVPVPAGGETHPLLPAALHDPLSRFLDLSRTLTTRLHVVGPTYVEVKVAAKLASSEDAVPGAAPAQAHAALRAFFDPFIGGPDGTGWPFGRHVFVSEVYAVLQQAPLVDYVEEVRVIGRGQVATGDDGAAGIELDEHELVMLVEPDLVSYHPFDGRVPPEDETTR